MMMILNNDNRDLEITTAIFRGARIVRRVLETGGNLRLSDTSGKPQAYVGVKKP